LIRIVPLYWAATVIAAALVPPDGMRLAASLLFVPQRAPGGAIFPVLVQGWTLQYEMFFYLLFAASLRLQRTAQLAVISCVLLGLAAVSLFGLSPNPIIRTYTDPVLLEFLSGIWLAVLWRSGRLVPRYGAALLLLGIVSFAAAGFSDRGDSDLPTRRRTPDPSIEG
jgi:exopolysaccharide production protein ExoZ